MKNGDLNEDDLFEGPTFQFKAASHVDSFLSALVNEHENILARLNSENQWLRERLLQSEGKSQEPLTTEVSLDFLTPLAIARLPDVTEAEKHPLDPAPAPVWQSDQSGTKSAGMSRSTSRIADTLKRGNSRTMVFEEELENVEARAEKEIKVHFPYPPEMWSPLQRFVFSNTFEVISGGVIVANTVVMAFYLQYKSFTVRHEIDAEYPTAESEWPHAVEAFDALDIVFNIIFILELVLRLWAHRLKSFFSGWIWFDFIIITLGLVDTLSKGGGFIDPGMMRLVRLIRLIRLLKVFHAMVGVESLFLMIKAVKASMYAAIWSFMIVGFCQLITGLFLCQYLQDFLMGEGKDLDFAVQVRLYTYFGSFTRALLTMFEVAFGNWTNSCRALMDHVHEWFSVFFMGYRCLFLFAVLKVIAAVFITETNRVLEHDDDLTIIKGKREKAFFERKYDQMVARLDKDKDGVLTWDELHQFLTDEEMMKILSVMGVDRHDLLKMFWLMMDKNGGGEMTSHEFFTKLRKVTGPAKKIDAMTLLKVTHRIDRKLQQAFEQQGLLERDAESDEELQACKI